MKCIVRFGKHCPQYSETSKISERIGNVAYELELPEELATIHSVCHISMLEKCTYDSSLIVATKNFGINDSLSC